MKKILALVMAAMMLLACTAFAEPTKIEYGDDNTMVFAREVAYEAEPGDVDALGNKTNSSKVPTGIAHVTAWGGEWVLVAAYVSEDAIEEFEYDVEAGYYAVPENAIIMNIEPVWDGSNTDPAGSGPIVDQGNYWHAHAYDLKGTLTFAEQFEEEEPYTFSNQWSEWNSVVYGEADGDFNFGPCKTFFKGEDKDFLRWVDVTGLDFEDMEDMKYIGMNVNGQMIICSTDKNITTNAKAKVLLAYVFEKVVPAEAAE